MDSVVGKMDLTEPKFLLRRFEQRMNNFISYSVDVYGGMVNAANKVSRSNKDPSGCVKELKH